jgi:hypothetical protein
MQVFQSFFSSHFGKPMKLGISSIVTANGWGWDFGREIETSSLSHATPKRNYKKFDYPPSNPTETHPLLATGILISSVEKSVN